MLGTGIDNYKDDSFFASRESLMHFYLSLLV